MTKEKEKEYIITYKSKEHYEVLGYVKATSLEKAKKEAIVKLQLEAKYYNVSEAEIDEISVFDKIFFAVN